MEFLARAAGRPARLGILSGSFHPVTRAHLALGEAALEWGADEVLFVMPRQFPHKQYEGVGLADRIELVRRAAADNSRFSVAISEGGLFIDIARDCRDDYGHACELWFVCGRDAAERIVTWDYGAEDRFEDQLSEFGLLVAERQGRYEPPQRYLERIRNLKVAGEWNAVSATEIRTRIAAGMQWSELVPEAVKAEVERLYSALPFSRNALSR